MNLDIAVEPIITDNTAFTVLTALRSLGYAELQHVQRADHIILDVEDGGNAERVVEKIARYVREDARDATSSPGFEALVRDRDVENGRLLATLSGTFGIRGLRALERAVAWHLIEANGEAGRERLDWSCRVLLANSVSQRYWIRPMPSYKALAVAVP
jgi:phosphoribosylformylglycinamidine (FGAM) synthase PurS component